MRNTWVPLTLGMVFVVALLGAASGDDQGSAWPLPKFHFLVRGLPSDASFQEITGLDPAEKVIEFRKGADKAFRPIKMPGLGKAGNVTMRKGIFTNDNQLWTWFNQIKLNTISRRTITISLVDDLGKPKMTWTLKNAWPTKITGADLKSDGNEVAIESVEIAYETVTVKAP